jgi:hypothetical protein
MKLLLITTFLLSFAVQGSEILDMSGENFRRADLKDGQCTVALRDTETGWTPKVQLESLTSSVGDFTGGDYLSDWNNEYSDKEYIVSVEYLKGHLGNKVLKTEVHLNYGKTFTGKDILKDSRHVIFLDQNFKVSNFMEKLGLTGASKYIRTDLVSVPQEISMNDKKLSFTRTTTYGISLSVSCDLD